MISKLRAAISRQLSQPTGVGGRVVAALMNRGNRDLNRRAIDLLDVGRSARALDLGFGGGLALPLLLERAAHVTAVDRAQDMVAAAAARHADDIAAGRLTVLAGDVGALPLDDGSVDRVLTVNTVYFWRDLESALRELRRVMRPGARLVIGIRDGVVMERVDHDIFTIRTPTDLAVALGDAGFDEVDVASAADRKTHLLAATNAR
ncbi:MAG: class I SAM-dependent methyltransferase [Solirubrobacteraceae bacterium]|nr:class I SAM-dependent methyltransferase [Solirubrobacteraceae bacterium]